MGWVPDRDYLARCARLCELAYLDPDTSVVKNEMLNSRFVTRKNTQAYVIRQDLGAEAVVVFRGTQVLSGFQWGDIKTNLRGKLLNIDEKAAVHSGYYKDLNEIASGLLEAIAWAWEGRQLSVGGGPRTLFLGHSMGGCLATLAAVTGLLEALGGIRTAITFGAPKVGNAAFAKQMNNVLRVVYADDIAPKYPFYTAGYEQGGAVTWINRNGHLYDSVPWLSRFYAPFPGRLAWSITDHSVEHYARILAAPPEGERD